MDTGLWHGAPADSRRWSIPSATRDRIYTLPLAARNCLYTVEGARDSRFDVRHDGGGRRRASRRRGSDRGQPGGTIPPYVCSFSSHLHPVANVFSSSIPLCHGEGDVIRYPPRHLKLVLYSHPSCTYHAQSCP
ncbi:hypothetical protein BOTBODRAFT_352019 [Botryobasidium botryosum FD-172 SS1]|uniref:Uncharacterized protein n=1 Tax=Botryobasidium botryosum (strain FD-172 SS1) TaxID=930990 RepID=A0A067MHF3_BOTB1|nr:hypothetical protein BOTBODRAFT_352019 [Botryobasidium botryosum FD-172 SS1]